MWSRYCGAPAPVRGLPQNGLYWNSTWASQYTTFWPSFWWLLLFACCISRRPELWEGNVTRLITEPLVGVFPGLMSAAMTKSGPRELLNFHPAATAAEVGNGQL